MEFINEVIKMKRIPNMTNLPKDEDTFRTVLGFLETDNTINDFDKRIMTELNYSIDGAKKLRRTLNKFEFISIEGNDLSLSPASEEFMENDIDFNEFTYRIFTTCRFEVIEFLTDLIDIIRSSGEVSKNNIYEILTESDYSANIKEKKPQTIQRYLRDLIKRAEHANIIEEVNGKNMYVIGNKADEYIKDSNDSNFFVKLHKKILNYYFKDNIITPNQWLRLHRLYLRSRAIGGRSGLETQMKVAENKWIPRLDDAIIEYKRRIRKRKPGHSHVEVNNKSLWLLNPNVKPYDWQNRCLDRWKREGRHGVVEAVTGTGKTILAFMAIDTLKRNHENLVISIIVPTKALMYQWKQSLINDFQVNEKDIGLRGDGHHDSYLNDKQVIIYIYNSAVLNNNIISDIESIPDKKHFMIVDECHRSGSPEFRRIFDNRFEFTLGLSATPNRPTDDTFTEIIEPNLGKIIFRYTFKEALDENIIPPFEIYNLAIQLTTEERTKYEELTDIIRKTVKKLKGRYYDRIHGVPEELFEAILRKIQSEIGTPDPDISRYFSVTSERKRSLYKAENRWECLKYILEENRRKKVILFHESIAAVDWKIYGDSYLSSKNILLYHSGLSTSTNKVSLDLYRRVPDAILVSVKALIEGLDVPDTDVGIIVASSSSSTQRIQSMGRILRQTLKKKASGGISKLYVIYAHYTTDERIFPRINWSSIADEEAISFNLWRPGRELEPIEPPLPTPKRPSCEEVDVSILREFDEYTGQYAGLKFGCDYRGKPFKKVRQGRKYLNSEEWQIIAKKVMKVKPSGGAFIVNQCGHILIKGKKEDKLCILYLGEIDLLSQQTKGE